MLIEIFKKQTRWFFICAYMTVSLFAYQCNGEEAILKTEEQVTFDGLGDCNAAAQLADKTVDTDGDGLTDFQELSCRDIQVETTGTATFTARTVQSNPNSTDSDSDGLDDLEEYNSNTDPTRADTDGDSLSDQAELHTYLTNPVSVDSDSDSTGNPQLFDGKELTILGTSPNDADTDGDGLDDYKETIQYANFNPLVADVAKLQVDISQTPEIGLNCQTTAGTSVSYGTSRLTGAEKTMTSTTTNSFSRAIENSHTVGTEVSATMGSTFEYGKSFGYLPSGEFEWSVTAGAHYDFTTATTNDTTFEYSKETASAIRNEYQVSQDMTKDNSVTCSGGYIQTAVTVKNIGNLAFTLNNLTLSLYQQSSYSQRVSVNLVGNLNPAAGTTFNISLGPGESTAGYTFELASQDVFKIQNLMRDPSGLSLSIADYDVDIQYADSSTASSVFLQTGIEAKTARVFIDYGDGRPAYSYQVATNTVKDPAGGFQAVPVTKVLNDILKLNQTTVQRPFTLSDNVTTANANVLQSLDDKSGTTFSRDEANRTYWIAYMKLFDRDVPVNPDTIFDFETLELRAGDTLHLVYAQDKDNDYLGALEETLAQTSDLNPDTDGDGLTDWQEVKEGWQVAGITVFPNPNSAVDYDLDNLNDVAEKARGTDPYSWDTDGDSIPDDIDQLPTIYSPPALLTNFAVTDTTPPGGQLYLQMDWDFPVDALGNVTSNYAGAFIYRSVNNSVADFLDANGQPAVPVYTAGIGLPICSTANNGKMILVHIAVLDMWGNGQNYGTDYGCAGYPLVAGTTYHYKIFQYDWLTYGSDVLMTNDLLIDHATAGSNGTGIITQAQVTSVTKTSVQLDWAPPVVNPGNYSGVVILRSSSNQISTASLVDGTVPLVGATYLLGDNSTATVMSVVTSTVAQTFTDSVLPNTAYHYYLVTYDNTNKFYRGIQFDVTTPPMNVTVTVNLDNLTALVLTESSYDEPYWMIKSYVWPAGSAGGGVNMLESQAKSIYANQTLTLSGDAAIPNSYTYNLPVQGGQGVSVYFDLWESDPSPNADDYIGRAIISLSDANWPYDPLKLTYNFSGIIDIQDGYGTWYKLNWSATATLN